MSDRELIKLLRDSLEETHRVAATMLAVIGENNLMCVLESRCPPDAPGFGRRAEAVLEIAAVAEAGKEKVR